MRSNQAAPPLRSCRSILGCSSGERGPARDFVPVQDGPPRSRGRCTLALKRIALATLALLGSGIPHIAAGVEPEELFVALEGFNKVAVYDRTASGAAAPLRTLEGASTLLDVPHKIVADVANAELLVLNAGNRTVTVYTLTAAGNQAPVRTLQAVVPGGSVAAGLALDPTNDELVVASRSVQSVTRSACTRAQRAEWRPPYARSQDRTRD